MNESTRTIAYVVTATAALLIAWFATPRVDISPQELAAANLGKWFYADFTNPREPTAIRVVTYNEEKATSKVFAVEFKNGLWTIPSHHNYPADGADRLARTAASVVGVTRDELKSTSAEDHEQLGVIDPLSSDSSKLKGRGQRITLSKGEETLVDLIIGKQVRDRTGNYYVRRPDETSTYVSKLDIDLSTKFEDWVETDLLKLERDEVTDLVMNNYKVDPVRHELVQGDVNRLHRDKSADPWVLEELKEDSEELENQKLADMIGALDELKLVGVRPKAKGVRADLSIDTDIVKNQLQLSAIVAEMEARGFLIAQDENQSPHLYANSGELEVGSNKGVRYTLRFGEVFVGDEMAVESGIEADKKKADDAEKTDKEAGDGGDKKDPSGKKSSRYMFVTTAFDPTLLGPKPVEPKNPEAATGDDKKPAEAAEEKETGDKPEPKKKSTKPEENCGPQDEPKPESKPEPVAKPDEGGDAKPAKAETKEGDKPASEPKPKTAEELKKEYQEQLTKYKADLKAYEDKEKAGKEKVEQLNRRFGDWYYVISSDNFNKLHLSRKELVKAKSKTIEDKPGEKSTDEKSSPKDDASAPSDDAKPKPARGNPPGDADQPKEEPAKEKKPE